MRPTLSTGQFHALANRIAEYSGFMLDGSRHRSLENALATRMELLSVSDERTYLQQLDAAELHRLTELVVNHETQFFRTPAHHRALREHVLPALLREASGGSPLRCWSAGCATGEEPYSLAISVLETWGEPLPRPVEIYATDISSHALSKAQVGVYRGRSLLNVVPDELRRRFTADHGSYSVRPAVRDLVRFEQHNLHSPLPLWARSIDILFCQNVTIYFSVETCRALMSRFWDVMTPGGYLFLGFSETLWRIFDRFETVELAGTFVYRKPVQRTVSKPRLPAQPRPPREVRPTAAVRRPPRNDTLAGQEQFDRGSTLLQAGALEEALDALQLVKPDHPLYPRALAAIARIHANRGAWDDARAVARRAVEVDALMHEAHLLLGIISANLQKWDDAVAHLERVRYIEPYAPLPSFHLANAYRGQQRLDLAEREYRSALRKLNALPATDVLDGVTVAWLRDTCQRFLQHLQHDQLQQR
jgi:chemotaxis protein methyltransferase CheR